jgi:hypothetical protein
LKIKIATTSSEEVRLKCPIGPMLPVITSSLFANLMVGRSAKAKEPNIHGKYTASFSLCNMFDAKWR